MAFTCIFVSLHSFMMQVNFNWECLNCLILQYNTQQLKHNEMILVLLAQILLCLHYVNYHLYRLWTSSDSLITCNEFVENVFMKDLMSCENYVFCLHLHWDKPQPHKSFVIFWLKWECFPIVHRISYNTQSQKSINNSIFSFFTVS